ncbi:hypothetical protein AMK68_00215 [candidate division KD3-62 bacterium DG_56]|uniref:Tyr recombinase domain-containing protein n=1 Tax=candidate division KD3-62 bacterium DG_56 TaxID=1704032 RepID=A0A0S7XSM1_9BACT|nr:MAG: hypothetical protein AMK68_00215 [candidate division KD3-62 bacterium DG_56]
MAARRLPTFLEPDELDALLRAAANPLQRLYFLLCARAGLRAFEAAGLRWDDLRWEDGRPRYIHVRRGKGGKEAHLPIPKVLGDALQELYTSAYSPYVFPGRKPDTHIITRTAQFWMSDAAARAGLAREKRHLHALRHTYATELLRGGVNIRDVQDLMRHSNIQTTSIYLHTTPERLAAAVDVLD